jgi:hypothetical protein
MSAEGRIAPSGDDEEDRIRELLRLENEKHADAIAECHCTGERPEELLRYWSCKLRCCPACTQCMAMIVEDAAVSALQRIRRPIVVRLALSASYHSELRATWATLRELVTRLRAETLRGVSRAFGIIYSVAMDDSASVRLDIAMDANKVDLAAMERKWQDLTGGEGKFSLLRKLPTSAYALAEYFGSSARLFPEPGSLALPALQSVLIAMKGRRLTVNWRAKRGGKNRAVAR